MKGSAIKRRPVWLLLILLPTTIALAQEWPLTQEEFDQHRQAEINTKRAQFDRLRLVKSLRMLPNQTAFDVNYYRLDIALDPADSLISGTLRMRATALTDNLDTVVLDFLSNMIVQDVSSAASYTHASDLLTVELEQPVAAGDTFSIAVAYVGRPAIERRGFGFDLQDGTPIIWSLSQPYFARGWWPCKDHPSDKADSADILLTVPDKLYAVSNGSLRDDTLNGDGTRTFHWHESYPIATYLVSVAITNYDIYTDWFRYSPDDSMEVSLYLYPSFSESPTLILDQLDDMLTYFHQVFGPYPFITEKYGIAQFPWGGGMEHQTITSQGSFREWLTVHELAHMWWGDKITNARWGDIWLNEGFASYAEVLYAEHMYGEDFRRSYMQYMDKEYIYPIFVEDTTDRNRLFDRTVYDKAAWFLHMLRYIVGDATFFEILLEYSNDPRFAYGTATTAGFQDVCETIYGQNLDWFFEPWIYHAGRPLYRVGWNSTDSLGGHKLTVYIQQTQVPLKTLFPMPLDITIRTEGEDTVVTVFNDLPEQYFEFLIVDRPTRIVLDSEGWILKRVLPGTGNYIPPVDFALEQNYPNPFHPSLSPARINYKLPVGAYVHLRIYDLLGREVATLVDGRKPMGIYKAFWYGVDHSGEPVPNGVYFYNLELRDPSIGGVRYSYTRKIILLR